MKKIIIKAPTNNTWEGIYIFDVQNCTAKIIKSEFFGFKELNQFLFSIN